MTTTLRRCRAFVLLILAAALVIATPVSAEAESYRLCSGYDSCNLAGMPHYGYKENSGNRYWGMYEGHNCTNYVAYRFVRRGMANVRPWSGDGMAYNWGRAMASSTNGTPTKGSVAWWGANQGGVGRDGHVAYVERVEPDGSIVVSEDNAGQINQFYWRKITRGAGWPSGFIHINDDPETTPIQEGNFVAYRGDVYRIAGGAPIYVSTWDHVGGPQSVRQLSDGEFAALRWVPRDGTFIVGQAPGHPDNGTVYRIAGGAPIYVATWDHMGGPQPVVGVDLAAVHQAGQSGRWSHLNYRPTDGTFIVGQQPGDPEHGSVYRIAGGAPIYVSDWANVGGPQPVTPVDLVAIHKASQPGRWSHLNYRPASGTVLRAGGKTYVTSAGAPLWQLDSRPGLQIDPVAIAKAGQRGRWSHLLRAKRLAVSVKPASHRSRLFVDVGPDWTAKNYRFHIERKARSGWRRVGSYYSSGKADTRTVDLRAGTYRVAVPSQRSRSAVRSPAVTLIR